MPCRLPSALVLALLAAAGLAGPAAGQEEGPIAKATFAGGCFWCMEPPFDALDGVVSTTSGYTGGHLADPTYEQVSAGGTGHAEAVEILYDPARVSYEELLDVFWHNIDPTTADAQFCDHGDQYRSAVFVHDEEQRRRRRRSRPPACSPSRSSPRSSTPRPSTRPRTTTRTTT